MKEKAQNKHRLVVGAEVIPLERDRCYAVKLPSDATLEEIDQTRTALWNLRLADTDHAPRFIVCRSDIDIELVEDVWT